MPTVPRNIAAVFPPVIHIYSFASDPDHDITPVQPLEADILDDTTARPVLVVQLELPHIACNVNIDGFDLRPDPAFPWSEASVGPQKPFTQDPGKGVLVFELHLDPEEGVQLPNGIRPQTKAYELFVLRDTLVTFAREGEERLALFRRQASWRAEVERTIQWSAWGEKGSRMLDISMPQRIWVRFLVILTVLRALTLAHQVCSCSGYRFISLISSSPGPPRSGHDGPTRCDLRLLDFSPTSVRRELSKARDDDDECSVSVKTGPTILPAESIWTDDVRSELPFCDIVRRKGIHATGVMMDDQRVMVICVSIRFTSSRGLADLLM